MRTRLLFLGACVVSSTTAPAPIAIAQTAASNPTQEYSGVYISSPDEDYFTPCGVETAGDTWSLRFRDGERHAPFLKKVTAIRGFGPLTHFIRVRGRLGPPGRYNVGFQTRELAVDSVLEVKESLEPCRGFGVPAAWSIPIDGGEPKLIARSFERATPSPDGKWLAGFYRASPTAPTAPRPPRQGR